MENDKTKMIMDLERKILASPGKARQLLAAYRSSSRMPNWKREKCLDTIYLLRTYFLEKDYIAMSVEEFSSFWEKHRQFIEAVFTWDFGMQFFKSWVLDNALPIWVRSSIVNSAGRMSWFSLPKRVRDMVGVKDEDEMLLLQQVRDMNLSGAMILLDLWGRAISAELIIELINLRRSDILERLLSRKPELIPSVVKAEDLATYVLGGAIDTETICRASQMLESKCPGVIKERIGSIISELDTAHAYIGKKQLASRLYGNTGR